MRLTRSFYNRNTLDVARELLGKNIVRVTESGIIRGRIVETEAYAGIYDPASHTFQNRQTDRNAIWYGEGGYAYVYQIHGIYYCLGIVTEQEFSPGAVLIRAVEPIEGIGLIKENRLKNSRSKRISLDIANLCDGPSKFCMAFNIDKRCNHVDLCGNVLFLEDGNELVTVSDIVFSPRINVDYSERGALYYWRFHIRDNGFISVKEYEPLRSWLKNEYPSLKEQRPADLFSYSALNEEPSTTQTVAARTNLENLPKIELHLHLEGCVNIETILKLASKNNTNLPKHILDRKSIHFSTFDEFVHTYYSICNSIVSEQDFRLVIGDVIEYVNRNHIIYSEVSWTPFLYLNRGLEFDRMMAVMNEELETHKMRDRIKFIIDIQRDHGFEAGEYVYSQVFHCQDSNIVGIGLTGQEQGFSPSIYRTLYENARDKGFGCTAHAGEYGSSVDVWKCIEDLGATRIGHGIRALDDYKLMDHIVGQNIHLEICPTSNIKLERVINYSSHPLAHFHDRNINFGINSDDPGIFQADLTDEYLNVINYLNFTLSDIKESLINSIGASFASDICKRELNQQILDYW